MRLRCAILQAIEQAGAGGVSNPPSMQAPAVDIYKRLVEDLDTEGRYLFLNALANQLRFPNNHTHYFSCVLLYLFSEAQQVRASADSCSFGLDTDLHSLLGVNSFERAVGETCRDVLSSRVFDRHLPTRL